MTAMALLLAGVLSVTPSALATPTPTRVLLGTAEDFAVLAGSTITNTGPTTISGDISGAPRGDVGLHPGTDIAGQTSITLLGGNYHVANAVALDAKNALVTAYNDAAGRPTTSTIATELGGTVLGPGVYDSEAGTFGITETLTLDGQGDPDSVFIFKMASTLITAPASRVVLINGARFCRVFWQVGSSATLGTNSTFVGHIMAMQSITANTGATIYGQLLAREAAVTLDANTIVNGFCGIPTVSTPLPGMTQVPTYPPLTSTSTAAPTQASTPTATSTPIGGVTQVPGFTLPPRATLMPGVTFIPGTTLVPWGVPFSTRLPATGDDTSGITTLGIVAIFAGIAFILAGAYVYTDRQRKKRS